MSIYYLKELHILKSFRILFDESKAVEIVKNNFEKMTAKKREE